MNAWTSSSSPSSSSTLSRTVGTRRRLAPLSTARLFHIFILLNGCGFSLVVFLWTKDHYLTAPQRSQWQEGNGRRGTLEVSASNNHVQRPNFNRTQPSMDQIKDILQFLNQTATAATYTSTIVDSSTAADAASSTEADETITPTLIPQPESEEPQLAPDEAGRLETIRRLAALGVNISEYIEFLPFLPEWAEVVAQYGNGPKIHGLDTCQRYRDEIPFYERTMAPTGLFNSGTNLLAFLMEDNCEISTGMQRYGGCRLPQRGISWQPPWGKHNPIAARFSDYSINKTIYTSIPHQVVLPVVTVRHPFDWMNSTCRHRYALRFGRWDREDGKVCPFIVAKPPDERPVPVYIDYAYPGRIYYRSLAHLWNRWNRPYFDAVNRFGNRTFASVTTNRTLSIRGKKAPRLMVRHEDLIFFPDQVVKQVCECIGGNYLFHGRGFQLTVESAKWGPGHGASKTGLLDAWIKYGRARGYENFDPLDKAKAIEFFDKEMLRAFHYEVK